MHLRVDPQGIRMDEDFNSGGVSRDGADLSKETAPRARDS